MWSNTVGASAASSSSANGEGGPFLALGMVVAPFAAARRQQARDTMLTYEPVKAGRVVFRFVVGNTLHDKKQEEPTLNGQFFRKRFGANSKPPPPPLDMVAMKKALDREVALHKDIAVLDALDGPGIEVAQSCIEKMNEWVRYALRTWPSARFIGKTEDDTYVQIAVLESELRALMHRRNLLLGYMTLAVLPTRPTRFPERAPKKACVTATGECVKDARNRRRPYTEGCFLGDLESKLEVPGRVHFDADNRMQPGRRRELINGEVSPIIGWWKGAIEHCGMSVDRGTAAAAKQPPRRLLTRAKWIARGMQNSSQLLPLEQEYTDDSQMSTMAPFPTGPLAVFGRDLATSLFEDCAYLKQYEASARLWGRKTLCRGPMSHLSFASTLCDTVLSHWLAKCDVDVTIAHTTRTKSHHYMWRGAGLGWMPPSNISLAVHYLKNKPTIPSGPNNTIGGEWQFVHDTVKDTKVAAFPNLLYKMRAGYNLNLTATRRYACTQHNSFLTLFLSSSHALPLSLYCTTQIAPQHQLGRVPLVCKRVLLRACKLTAGRRRTSKQGDNTRTRRTPPQNVGRQVARRPSAGLAVFWLQPFTLPAVSKVAAPSQRAEGDLHRHRALSRLGAIRVFWAWAVLRRVAAADQSALSMVDDGGGWVWRRPRAISTLPSAVERGIGAKVGVKAVRGRLDQQSDEEDGGGTQALRGQRERE